MEKWSWGAPRPLGSPRFLANECLRKRNWERKDTAQAEKSSQHRPSKNKLPKTVWGILSDRSELKGAWVSQALLPGPQFSHLRNGNMTCVTGLFEQLYKRWADTIYSVSPLFYPEHGKVVPVFSLMTLGGWIWREVQAKYRGFCPRPQELSRGQHLEGPVADCRTQLL